MLNNNKKSTELEHNVNSISTPEKKQKNYNRLGRKIEVEQRNNNGKIRKNREYLTYYL